jgi:glycosyltransferase involved in cell wall biosynthesis
MNIYIYSSSSDAVGVAKNTLALAKALIDRGNQVKILTINDGWLVDQCGTQDIPHKVFRGRSVFVLAFLANIYLLATLENSGNTVLHLNGRITIFSILMVILIKRRVKYRYSIRQFSSVGEKGIWGWKEWLEEHLMSAKNLSLHAVSKSLADEVADRTSHKKNVTHIPNFLQLFSEIEPEINRPITYENFKFNMIFVGRLSCEKGADILIDAMKLLMLNNKNNVRFSLDIYGSGPELERLKNRVSKLSLEQFVSFKGHRSKVRSLFWEYDALIIPSRSESFGLVAIEAFSEGLPVIASNVTGLSETVENAALTFPAGDIEGLAAQINRVQGCYKTRTELRAKGYARALEFSEEKILPEFEVWYKGEHS